MSDPGHGPGMTLESFRVWHYHSIRDSGHVPVSRLTALVGREQSGKTTLLHALRGLEPRVEAPYSLAEDWPRTRNPRPTPDQVVCAAHFRLLDGLRRRWGAAGILGDGQVGLSVGRTYAGNFVFLPWDGVDERGRIQRHPAPEPAAPRLAAAAAAALPEFLHASPDARAPRRIPLTALRADALHDEASEENGVAAVARLLAADGFPAEDPDAAANRAVARAEEALNARLVDAGFRRDLRLRIDGDHLALSIHDGEGHRSLERLSPADRFRLALDLRIVAALLPAGQPPVVLLDAPGRAFRGGMKRQLRPALLAYAETGVTVIYTSRLPFHVELEHPEQVLVLAPADDETGPLCRPGSPRGDYKVTAALGMQGRSSFRIDERNLVVEGPTDVGLLRAFDRLFQRSGAPGLPPDMNVVGAGGSYEVVAVATFLARQGLGVVALLDSDSAGFTAAGHFAEEPPTAPPIQVLLLGDAAGLPREQAAIEDLVDPDLYLDAARALGDPAAAAFLDRTGAAPGDEGSERPNSALSRVLRAQGLQLSKAEVAEELATRVDAMATLDELPPATAAALRRLFASIRGAAARLAAPASTGRPAG